MSDFQDEGRLDTSQVEDRRGRSIGGRPAAIGGGGLALVIAVVVLLLGGNPFGGSSGADLGVLSDLNNNVVGEGAPQSDISQKCQTGADAETAEDCRAVAYVNSIRQLLGDGVRAVQPAKTVFFSGSADTACGTATSAVGPFYCPADEQVYIDLGFFDELRDRFGAQGGPFARGLRARARVRAPRAEPDRQLDQVRAAPQTGPGERRSVRLELQADCYAGVWAATRRSRRIIAEGVTTPRSPTPSTPRRRWATTGSSSDAGPGEPGDLDARLVGPAGEVAEARLHHEGSLAVRHVRGSI